MNQQLIQTKMHPCVKNPLGDEAALFLQEELVAAIHGAFEVAVEIAVREVKTRVSQATSDMYEELRRENESLKQRLQRAEAQLGGRGDRRSPQNKPGYCGPTKRTDRPPQPEPINPKPAVSSVSVNDCSGATGESPPAGHSGSHQSQQRSSSNYVGTQTDSDDPKNEQNKGCSKDSSHVVKVEQMNPPCPDPRVQLCDSPPCPTNIKSTLEQVTVKQERLEDEEEEEEMDGSSCCLDLIKMEDFTLDHVSVAQSKMLEDWKPDVFDIQSQDPNTQDHPAESPSRPPPPTDLPSISSEFPNVFELTEPAPSQVYGVHSWTSRSHSHTAATIYTCKSCGQTFHLPSLLRRHYGHCKQRQRCPLPIPGSKRTRLQLYPPGCSPYRCSECNREFNRMENLKTHLRIHTGERPYTCSVCSKCFRHSGALTRHFRIHTGEKPYTCVQCGKSFRNCGGLKFHQRSHSNQLQ